MKTFYLFAFLLVSFCAFSQVQDSTKIIHTDTVTKAIRDTAAKPIIDSTPKVEIDTSLRIINLNPYFTVHVDSTLTYQLLINKNPANYFWYLRNSPVGLRVNKDNGLLTFRADKSYFLSGRLKYDYNYKVTIGVQNLANPKERIDTSFTIVFYSTEIIPSYVKPTVSGTIWVDEGETVAFKVLCETGSFPIESILTIPNVAIGSYNDVKQCGDEFRWTPGYDFVKETDSAKVKLVNLSFIGSTKFKMQDTARVKITVRNALNYPLAKEQYSMLVRDINTYILQLKYTFLQIDRTIKNTKRARTTFDLTAAATALSGTVLSTSTNQDQKRTGAILPSVGVAIQPIKEATAPNKTAEQNQASLVRASIKRLDYVLRDNILIGERDPDLPQKMANLKNELKQSQMQLIDVPMGITGNMSEEALNKYFNSPKVNKKYRLK